MSTVESIQKIDSRPDGMQLLEVVQDDKGYVNIGIVGKLKDWPPHLIEYVADSLTSYADYMRSTLGKTKQ